MGGGASRQTLYLGELEKYISTARSSKDLSDKILTALFSVTDYTDLLALTKVEDCNRYVWVTAQAFDTLFARLQVQPLIGQSQEVRFVPMTKVLPPAGSAAAIERNKLCLNVAYIYVRIFQIYAALALTVMESNPARLRVVVEPTRGPLAVKGQFLMGGRQSGGAVPAGDQLKRIGYFAVLKDYMRTFGADGIEFVTDMKTSQQSAHDRSFYFNSKAVVTTGEGSTVAGKWYMKGRPEVDITISLKFSELNIYQLLINGTEVETFTYVTGGRNPYVSQENFSEDPEAFLDRIQGIVGVEQVNMSILKPGRATTAAAAPAAIAAAAPGAAVGRGTAGSDLFTGYANIRKTFMEYRPVDGKTTTAGFFPKAYCVARAMTLLTPLFDSERTDKNQPFYSQICRRTFDFEGTQELMPRTGRHPKMNLYFKSLVALYYDDFTVSGGQVIPSQTETGRSELRDASALLAKLHRVPPSASGENFIESTQPFRGPTLCGGTTTQPGPSMLLRIKEDNFKRRIQSEVIKPMLDFQTQHAARVNALLKEMIQLTPGGAREFKFSPAITKGGRTAINDFGKRARAMLLDYYLKSEAFYIKGVVMFEQNPGKIEGVSG